MSDTRPRDVQVLPIATRTTVLRSRTWDRLKFEIEYSLQKGTTANAYLIQSDHIALFDPPGESFKESFLAAFGNISQRLSDFDFTPLGKMAQWFRSNANELAAETLDPREIDYLILSHVNPNRAVTLKALLQMIPDVTIVCSNPAAIALREILSDYDLKLKVVKGGETLDLGRGHKLEFIPTPNPRFPGLMCTYDPRTQILFTDKLFGAHICGDRIFDEGWKTYLEDRQYYFDCLMAPHARQVVTALDKLATKTAKIYATGHGPLVRYGLRELTNTYRQWATSQQSHGLSVALIYASAYGNTAVLAQAIARGLTKADVRVESINAEVAEPEEVKGAVEKSAGIIMGSPTLGGHAPTQIQAALGIALAASNKTKLAGVFGSYGWSGEAIDLLESKFRDAGFTFGFDPIRIKFKPTDEILKLCEEAGTDFAQSLKKKQKSRQAKVSVEGTAQADRAQQALGRIINSLCVVTTQQGALTSGMLASWVSQATFSPPGLSLAVAKDRAIESLLHVGSPFVLNVLAEGQHLGLMKHFLKPFAPGEDRFQGVETKTAENGSPILVDALAYIECQVENRMECGDHWVIYAIAQQGDVLQEGLTAVHHRQTGSHY